MTSLNVAPPSFSSARNASVSSNASFSNASFSNASTSCDASFSKTERIVVYLVAGIFSLRMLAVFMILPIFAIFAKSFADANPQKVGLALGIYGLIQALLQPVLGYISDRLGRKPVIAFGLLTFALGSMVIAMSNSITGIIIGRSLQGGGAIGSVILALLSDFTREQVRLKAMAIVGISIAAAFALAFLIGPLLADWLGLPSLFWLMGAFSLIAIVLIYGVLPNPNTSSTANALDMAKTPEVVNTTEIVNTPEVVCVSEIVNTPSTGILTCLTPQLLPIYFTALLIHACLTALFLKLPLAITALMPEGNQTLEFYLPIFLTAALATFPCLSLIEGKRFQKQKTLPTLPYNVILIMCLVTLLISFFILYFGLQSWLGLGFGLCCFFTAFNVLEASLPSYLSKHVQPHYKGTALGIFSSLQFLGLCLGGVLGGYFDQHFGNLAVFAFCVILTNILLVWILILSKLKRFVWHVA